MRGVCVWYVCVEWREMEGVQAKTVKKKRGRDSKRKIKTRAGAETGSC